MKSHKRILKTLAKNHKLDPDEILIVLWDYPGKNEKFEYLKNENSVVKDKDFKFIKEVIGSLAVGKKPKQIQVIKNPATAITKKDYNFSSGEANDLILYLTPSDVLKIHEELTSDFADQDDPISPSGLKDKALMESALFHPQTSFDGKYKYPTVESAAAALMYAISNNHAFHNGNKRTAIVALLVFLDRHHIVLTCDEDALFRISIKLADHKMVEEDHQSGDAEIFALMNWINENSKLVKKGERPITLTKLRRRLAQFGCRILDNGRVERVIKRKYLPDKKLISKVALSDGISGGSEIDKGLVRSMRDDLMLTAENGIDSEVFYEDAEFSSSEFIVKYKGLLKRLSKV